MNEMETLQKNIYRQLNLELSKKPEEQNKIHYIAFIRNKTKQHTLMPSGYRYACYFKNERKD
jgi:hypothetical protein